MLSPKKVQNNRNKRAGLSDRQIVQIPEEKVKTIKNNMSIGFINTNFQYAAIVCNRKLK